MQSSPLSSSGHLLIRGSFVITAICEDGIIVASESRANIFDRTDSAQSPIAYYDTVQKVFPIGNAAVAETGQGLIHNLFFSAIIKEFLNALVRQPDVPQLLSSFFEFCKQHYPEAMLLELRKQKLFAAGFTNGQPTICYFNEHQEPGPFGCIKGSGFIQSAPTSFQEHTGLLSGLSCNEVAKLAEDAINEYAGVNDHWKTIGGGVDILRISLDRCDWVLKKTPPQEMIYIHDLIDAYRKGAVDISVIPPATKQTLEDLFSTVIPPESNSERDT